MPGNKGTTGRSDRFCMYRGGVFMGNRDFKKDDKKKKKTDLKAVVPGASVTRPIAPQPEVIKKTRKEKSREA